jgi:hypothetical protein
LKFGADEALRRDYLAANEARRRALLAGRVKRAPLPGLVETNKILTAGPTLIHELEWFASARDLCEVIAPLVLDADARAILAINPGVPSPPGRWSYVGFKGGSETGVLSTAWAFETGTREYVATAAASNPNTALPEEEVVQLMAAIRDFTPQFE